MDFSFEDSFHLCMLTSTQSQILPNFNNNICHLGRLSAAKSRKLSAHWCWGGKGDILSLSPPLANLSLLIPVLCAAWSLQDGGYFLHRYHVFFLGSHQGPSKWLPEPQPLRLLPSQQIFVYFISSTRTVSILPLLTTRETRKIKFFALHPYNRKGAGVWVSAVLRQPACCLTKAIANTDFKYL